KTADKTIIKDLKQRGLLVLHKTLQHSYPYCWRTDTPLMYKAISTWFVKVEQFKQQLINNNQQIKWLPAHIKNGRFGKWLENARDWAISRNRFWGTPIPIWKAEDGETICIGSVKQLEELSGTKITDLHKHFIDKLQITKHGKTFKRIPDVLDCWFESGSMPYAQNHYPFENKKYFESTFPADFIAEGLDQTRGWFYTLLVLSTAIMKKPPFKNVIVNGLILAEDGKKMSKRLKNYPQPQYILDTYGADALRLYMIGSPVVRGEYLKFSEQGIQEVMKQIILPLWNAFSFFVSYANIDNWQYKNYKYSDLNNALDRWIISYTQTLVEQVTRYMDNYDLQKAVPPLINFIERLTNWYIRRSRRRFWKSENDKDKDQAYFTLYSVLHKLALVLAPFTPFLSEKIYQVLTKDEQQSVHLQSYPVPESNKKDLDLEEEMDLIENIVSLGRSLRLTHKIKIRQPLKEMTVITKNKSNCQRVKKYTDLIKDELNIKQLSFSENEENYVDFKSKLNFKKLGKKLGPKVKTAASRVRDLDSATIVNFFQKGTIELSVDGEQLLLKDDDIIIERQPKPNKLVANENEITVVLDTALDNELINEGMARDFINKIQKARKDINLHYTDRIAVSCYAAAKLQNAVKAYADYIKKETLALSIDFPEQLPAEATEADVNGTACSFIIKKLRNKKDDKNTTC
ncbi:MAG TPA: class I tRNA ligase family protein, partial [Spirochaetota bacterium]|nr:class I tRNA ligase family protein [Spirochaetota bacterium]